MDPVSRLKYLQRALKEVRDGGSSEEGVQLARAALQFAFGAKNDFLAALDEALNAAQTEGKGSDLGIRGELALELRRRNAAVGQLKAAISAIEHGWRSDELDRPAEAEKSRAQLFCPHCGHQTWQRSEHAFGYSQEVEYSDGDVGEMELFYELRSCEMCGQALLYNGVADDGDSGALVFPSDTALPKGVSLRVRRAYNEAKRIKKSSPSAYAGQVRKAFEFACRDRGAQGVNLEQLVEWMTRNGHLPADLAKLGHVIRLVGNQGMHDEEEILSSEADILEELFVFALTYMYGFREKLETFEKQLAELEAWRAKRRGS